MKFLLAFAVVIATTLARPDGEYYDTRYDNFDVEELTNNLRLMKSYGNCFLSRGPCTVEGHDFKKIIPDAVKTSCGKCSPKQRVLIRKVIKGFQSKLPEMWDELVETEDPGRKYKAEFDQFINGTD